MPSDSPSHIQLSISLGLDTMVQASVHLSPNRSAHGISREGSSGQNMLATSSSILASRVWFVDLMSLLEGSPWEIPTRKDLLSQAQGTIFDP